MPTTTVGVLMSITPNNRVQLQKYPLEDIDLMRDLIYGEKGNTTTIITNEYPGYKLPLYQSFAKRLPNAKLNTTSSQYMGNTYTYVLIVLPTEVSTLDDD